MYQDVAGWDESRRISSKFGHRGVKTVQKKHRTQNSDKLTDVDKGVSGTFRHRHKYALAQVPGVVAETSAYTLPQDDEQTTAR